MKNQSCSSVHSPVNNSVAHTPGPWRLCYDGQIDGNDGTFVCSFRWDSFREFNLGNNSADARLIASCPDLFAALVRLSAQCERLRYPGQPMSDAEKSAIAVLAKVRRISHD